MKKIIVSILGLGLLFCAVSAYKMQDSFGSSVIGTVSKGGYELNSGALYLQTGGDQTGMNENIPLKFELSQNYPNPFNPTTTIQFSIPNDQFVKLNVYNIKGEVVTNLVNGNVKAGIHKVNFDTGNFVSGQYFYKIETDGFSKIRKMVLVK